MFRLMLPSMLVVAGSLSVPVGQKATAAPVTTAVQQAIAGNGLMQDVYYYRGHHYPYRHGGHYYNHRYYQNGRWRYY